MSHHNQRYNSFVPKRLIRLILAAALLIVPFWLLTSRAPQPESPASITFAQDSSSSGFARAAEAIAFEFPRDHGPHFDFQTEWWYYTGNLQDLAGNHFGYQLTFFRRGLTPGDIRAGAGPASTSALVANQIYFAHFAVTDAQGNTHTFAERFSRGAGGLSGASGDPFNIWLEDWNTAALNDDGSAVRLQAREAEMAIDLTLRAAKPLVAHGDRGLSLKSEERGNASYYVSFTRMTTQGQIVMEDQTVIVAGDSWFDHEWSTSALGPHGIGWDWFSLQLSDGRELMFFQIRRDDGNIEPVSGGTLVEKDGASRRLTADDIRINVTGVWRSTDTDTQYPAEWQISIPSAGIELTAKPWIRDQEMRLAFIYWEGAVKIEGVSNGLPITGNGYIELTGYKGSMQGVF